MTAAAPMLSICIPTYNRAEILDYCLERLDALREHGIDFEIVVSDNASPDSTAEVVEKHRRRLGAVRYCLQPIKCEPFHGYVNAIRNARGRYVVYLSDDDVLLGESLRNYLNLLESDSGLVAVYADWIAYDDEQGREIHRYFQFREPATFGSDDSLGVVNFLLGNIVYSEMGIIRRDALLRCDCMGKRIHQASYRWAYRLTRLGRVRFDLPPFYLENRILKKRFHRGLPDNLRLRMQTIGDEMRNELETILLWALQDAGVPNVPPDVELNARRLVDRYLNSRIGLEVQRAIAERNWILALDLRRRHVLWYGAGDAEQRQRDAIEIAIPAALQAIRDAYFNLSGVSGLRLTGFRGRRVEDFFRSTYPDIVVETDGRASSGRTLELAKYEGEPGSDRASDGYRFALDRLITQYSVNAERFDLSDL